MSVYTFPDGSVSAVVSRRRGLGRSGDDSWWDALDETAKKEDNRRRVSSRARQQLMRLIRKGNLRRLLTFTNGGQGDGWKSSKESLNAFMGWYRLEGSLLGQTAIVAVAERGKLGRWHVHVAIKAGYFIPYSQIIKSWSSFMEAAGEHSMTGTHRFHSGDEQGKHKSSFTSARWCARYMAKYLSKDFEDERVAQERRYRADGINPPEPKRFYPGSLAEAQAVANDMWPGCEVTWFEDADGTTAGFWLEWESPERLKPVCYQATQVE